MIADDIVEHSLFVRPSYYIPVRVKATGFITPVHILVDYMLTFQSDEYNAFSPAAPRGGAIGSSSGS
jgi:hypothetical protein